MVHKSLASNSPLKKEEVIEEIEESGLQKTETIQQKTIVSVQQKDDSEVRRWQVEVEEAEEADSEGFYSFKALTSKSNCKPEYAGKKFEIW